MKKQLLFLTTLFISVIGYAQTFTVNNIVYTVINGTNNVRVGYSLSYSGFTSVTIPSTVPYMGATYNVTSITSGAFSNITTLTSVSLPDSVISIGDSAFNNSGISSISLPNNLISIGNQAFDINNLSSITIPNSVTSIGNYAFQNNSITSVIIGESVTNIGNGAFRTNPLTSVTSLAITPPTITTVNGVEDSFNLSGDRSNIHLYIPVGTMGVYVTNPGALWTGFNTVNGVSLSISDFELANDIKVLTSTDAISVVASNNVRLENYTIYSLTGAKVSTGTESEITTSFLSAGIYILKLDFDRGTVVKKVAIN